MAANSPDIVDNGLLKPVPPNYSADNAAESTPLLDNKQTCNSDGDEKPRFSMWLINLLLFLCGISTFARTEAFLLQITLFQKCLGYGNLFYPLAQGLFFGFGALYLYILQYVEENVWTVPKLGIYTVAKRKLLIANISTALAYAVFFALPILDRPLPHALGYSLCLIVGAGATIQFQAFSKFLAGYPSTCMQYFIGGTYAASIFYAPLNTYLGDICHIPHHDAEGKMKCNYHHNKTIATTTASTHTTVTVAVEVTAKPHMVPMKIGACSNTIDWEHAWIFFGVAMFLTLSTLVMYVILGRLKPSKYYIALEERRIIRETKMNNVSDKQLGGAGGGSINDDSINDSDPLVNIADECGGDADRHGDKGDSTKTAKANNDGKTITIKAVAPQLIKVFVATSASALLSSQYGLTTNDAQPRLATYLIYEYYVCSALGTFLSMAWRATPFWTMAVQVIRIGVLPVGFLYAYGELGVNQPAALAFNFVFMIFGGWTFAAAFSEVRDKFSGSALLLDRALAWTNAGYFCGLLFGLSIAVTQFVLDGSQN